MIKSFFAALPLTLALAIILAAGCSKKIAVDTSKLDYSFQTADPVVQSNVTAAVEAIDKAEYPAALEKLKTVAANPKLTPDQKAAVDGVVQQLEKH